MNLNTCNFIKRIEQVLAELDISAIEDYVIIILLYHHNQNTDTCPTLPLLGMVPRQTDKQTKDDHRHNTWTPTQQ